MKTHFGRYFYGWVIVAVLAVSNFAQVGAFNPVLAIFMKPFGEDFGWTRAEVSLSITIGSFAGGLVGPFAGPIIDRHGPRIVLVVCQVILGTCLLSLSLLNGSLFHFLVAYSLGRMVVQGGTQLAAQVAIANWFARLRGRAMGVSTLGTRIGQALLPAIVAFITHLAGWRYAWFFLGSIVWIIAITPSFVFLRRRPEDVGLLPDGVQAPAPDAAREDDHASDASPGRDVGAEPQWTVKEAVRTRSLWFLTFATCQSYFLGAGINLHLFPYLTDVGLSLTQAIFASSAFFAVSAFGAISWGMLQDRFPLRYCMAVGFAISAVGIVLLLMTRSLPLALTFAVVYGFSFGGLNTLTTIMWAVYYGRANVGAIAGAMLPIQLLSNAIGPFFGGWMFDQQGNYDIAFSVYAILAATAALWAFSAGTPRQSPASKAPATTS